MRNALPPMSTTYGFLAGLVGGIGLAALAALYLTKAPLPFVNKVQPSTENVTPDQSDPNRPLFSPQIPQAAPGAAAPAAAPPPPAAADTGAKGAPSAPVPLASEPAGSKSTESSEPGGDASGKLMLQVGAYKSADDADATRARLALLGLDAIVTPVQVDGATLYRVRLGPYGRLDDLNGIRRTLSENGMEPQIVHLR